MDSLLPVDHVRFFLRSDFAIENGVVDTARRALSWTEFGRQCKPGAARFSWADWRRANEERAAYELPRYIGYVGLIAPNDVTVRPHACDGRRFFAMPADGLWADLEDRVRAAMGFEPGSAVPMSCAAREKPTPEWQMPSNAVVHDVLTANACIVEYTRALAILAGNWRSNSAH